MRYNHVTMNSRTTAVATTDTNSTRLAIRLLGPFESILDEQPVSGYASNNVRALLAYLAAEADRPHSRRVLAAVLWPECADATAADRFRNALSNLRRVLGDGRSTAPFLTVTRDAVQFRAGADSWVDATALSAAVDDARCGRCDAAALQRALGWVRGPFLQGLVIRNSPAFEEWVLVRQERIDRRVRDGLAWLAGDCERRRAYAEAVEFVRCQLEQEPFAEDLHQELMRLLALDGRRSAALDHYEACRALLARELDVEPADETKALRERIRRGELERAGPTVIVHSSTPAPAEPFVSREHEVARLDGFLEEALAGRGRVALVTGEAGSGKSALLRHFACRTVDHHDALLAACGTCNAHSGLGDPYLPFRELLQMLSAGTECGPAGFTAEPNLARRLWAALPVALPALTEHGPELIGRLVPADDLLLRAESLVPYETTWWPRLRELARRRAAPAALAPAGEVSPAAQPQESLFEQVSRVLQAISQSHPLLLVLDDLQWVDAGSAALLHYLGRRLDGRRILIVGAYRPEAVAIANGAGGRHTLQPVVNELQREFGDIRVDLERTETRVFVDALLDVHPNRLGRAFRDRLHLVTGGHALFTVELLRALRDNGELIRDAAGCWIEGPALHWDKLPPRIEAIIGERTQSLPAELRALLGVAAVAGEEFTAEVVARVCAADEKDTIRALSGPLGRERGLVLAARIEHRMAGADGAAEGARLSHYRFRHALFQKYLYDRLDVSERAVLHEEVGRALEALAAGNDAALAGLSPALAWHFEAGGLVRKAVHYLLIAARWAGELLAFEESLALATRGLDLLASLPASAERDRQELALRLALVYALSARAWGSAEQVQMMETVQKLCERAGDTAGRLDALFVLCGIRQGRAEFRALREAATQMRELAEQVHDPVYALLAHTHLATSCNYAGEFAAVLTHVERVGECYQDVGRRPATGRRTAAATSMLSYVRTLERMALWILGRADRPTRPLWPAAAAAGEHGPTPGLALALSLQLIFHYANGDTENIHRFPEVARALSNESLIPTMLQWVRVVESLREIAEDEPEHAIAATRLAIARWRAHGSGSGVPLAYVLLVDACMCHGQPHDALEALAMAVEVATQTDNHFWDAELRRLHGEIALALDGDAPQAEADFRAAIAVAQHQQAKSWELRAALSLARLWRERGRAAEARALLATTSAGFEEGFDSPDLRAAREWPAER